jgi:hypothetical protein
MVLAPASAALARRDGDVLDTGHADLIHDLDHQT